VGQAHNSNNLYTKYCCSCFFSISDVEMLVVSRLMSVSLRRYAWCTIVIIVWTNILNPAKYLEEISGINPQGWSLMKIATALMMVCYPYQQLKTGHPGKVNSNILQMCSELVALHSAKTVIWVADNVCAFSFQIFSKEVCVQLWKDAPKYEGKIRKVSCSRVFDQMVWARSLRYTMLSVLANRVREAREAYEAEQAMLMSAMDDGNKSRAAASLMSATADGKRRQESFSAPPAGRCPRCSLMAMCAGRREQGASSGGTRWGRRRVAAVKTTRPAMATTGLPVSKPANGCRTPPKPNQTVR
jgi:hypothetical protein